MCNNITNDPLANTYLEKLVNIVYNYKLFEIDIDDFLLNRSKYKDDNIIKENINKIDLRVLKRLLNIFTFDDSHKLFKSNIETSIQYKILQTLTKENLQNKTQPILNDIESLTVNLDDIWKI